MVRAKSSLPGLGLTLAIALVAYQLEKLPIPPFSIGAPARHPIDAMLIAIMLGVLIRNTVGLPERFVPGVRKAVLSIVTSGIVLMGAKLDFFDVVRTSSTGLVASVTCVVVALALTIWLCRWWGVGQKLGILVAVGTAICGGTAIAVVAPVIEADDNDTAFAMATVTLLGLVAVFTLPLLGSLAGMSQTEFGVWTGISVHATPQVIATGFAYGPIAGEVATIVKLVRVLLLAPVVIGIGVWYGRTKRSRQVAHVPRATRIATLFPPFILGFVLLALANTLHLLPDFTLHLKDSFAWAGQDLHVSLARLVAMVSNFLLTITMAGVGLGVHLRGLARFGLKAVFIGFAATIVLATFSFALLRAAL
jgi:uncharacterized integral membrane protein (TIGR00698 family)